MPVWKLAARLSHRPRGPSRPGTTLARVRVLLVGSGAREHALAWRLARGPSLTELHAAPGNPGIAALGDCHPVRADDGEGLLDLARTVAADLVVIGPEAPLVAGRRGHASATQASPCSGRARRRRGSKARRRSRRTCSRLRACRPRRRSPIARPPCVVKADGLAAGKGVFVCRTQDELDAGLRAAAALGETVVVEELLEGAEVSLFALCDGRRAVPLGAAQDFKRAFDGDAGPNTGGMGAYSPVPWLDARRGTRSSGRSTSRCSTSSPVAARRSSAASSPV